MKTVVIAALALLVAAPLSAQPKSCQPIAARVIARGQTLTADDIAIPGVGPCAQGAALIGSVTRRVIAAGEPLREPAVAAPSAIMANQRVSVVYRDAGIEVRLVGIAANAAPMGGRVTVRIPGNARSNQTSRQLDGTVIGSGLVQVQ